MTKSEYKLTEKQRVVLRYFIENESFYIDRSETLLYKDTNPTCKDGKKHFLAYQTKVHKDLESNSDTVSKDWAGKVCKHFYQKEILDYKEIRPRGQKNKTEYYFLRHNIEAFKTVIKMLVVNYEYETRQQLFTLSYFQINLTEPFIKNILNEKKVEMTRLLDIWDWEPSEARILFNEFSAKKDLSFKEYILRTFRNKYCYNRTDNHFSPCIGLRLPVLLEDTNHEYLKLVKQFNQETFNDNSLLNHKISGIADHYNRFQKNKWIIPLLSLMQASPKALEEFVYGDWKIKDSYSCVFSREGSSRFEYPFFRILFSAISDIALAPNIKNNNILFVDFRSPSRKGSDKSNWLLQIGIQSGMTVDFDGGFSKENEFMESENKGKITCSDERYYWTKTWVDYSTHYYSLKSIEIIDFELLIQKLVSKRDVLCKFLFDRLPNYMKNILLCYDSSFDLPDGFKNDLLFEMNEILFGYNAKNEIEYNPLHLTKYTLSEIAKLEEMKITNNYSKENIINKIFKVNRLVMEDSFENVIRKKTEFYGARALSQCNPLSMLNLKQG